MILIIYFNNYININSFYIFIELLHQFLKITINTLKFSIKLNANI